MKDDIWNNYKDNLDWVKFFKEGEACLMRKYLINGEPIKDNERNKYIISISAKGISAFLSYTEYPPKLLGPSLYQLLSNGKPLLLEEKIFPEYYAICRCRFMENEEKREMFERKRKKEPELIKEHINEEKQYFKDSSLLFNEVHKDRKSRIEKIKEAALYYPIWVEYNCLNSSPVQEWVLNKNKVGRPGSKERPLKEFFVVLSGSELDEFLCTIKILADKFKPNDFCFLIAALRKLGYLMPHTNDEIRIAFNDFLGREIGCKSAINKNLGVVTSSINKDRLSSMVSIITNIIEKNKLKEQNK